MTNAPDGTALGQITRPPAVAQPMRVDRVELRITGPRVDPAAWESHVARLRASEAEGDLADLASALRELDLHDEAGASWSYDGASWWRWDVSGWRNGRPNSSLALSMIELEVGTPHLPEAARNELGIEPARLAPPRANSLPPPQPTPAATPATPAGPVSPVSASATFVPTHAVPEAGMPVWATPDPAAAPVAELDPHLDVMAVEWRDDGWTRVVCSNTWSGWVDGQLLVAIR